MRWRMTSASSKTRLLRVSLLVRRDVEDDGVEDPQLELGREVADRSRAGRAAACWRSAGGRRSRSRWAKRGEAATMGIASSLPTTVIGHDRDSGPHGNLHETAPPEAA